MIKAALCLLSTLPTHQRINRVLTSSEPYQP